MSSSKFDADAQAIGLYKAMKGFGTDNKSLIHIVANTTNQQRQQIIKAYQRLYNKDLIKSIKSELSGNYEDAVIAAFETPVEYDVNEIIRTNKKKDEYSLIEIIATRPKWMLDEIQQRYKELNNNHSIEETLNPKFNESIKTLLTHLLQHTRRSNHKQPNMNHCKKQVSYLTSCSNWNEEGSAFNKIFYTSSAKELVVISKYYHKLTGKTLPQALDEHNEFTKEMKEYIKTVLFAVMAPSEYFATRVYKAIEGYGTDNMLLIRVLITRDELDMKYIRMYYKDKYKKEMIKDIEDDCSGNYKNFLVELAGHEV